MVFKLRLELVKIDSCIRGCMLFHENEFDINDGVLEECKLFQSTRYSVQCNAIDHKQK